MKRTRLRGWKRGRANGRREENIKRGKYKEEGLNRREKRWNSKRGPKVK